MNKSTTDRKMENIFFYTGKESLRQSKYRHDDIPDSFSTRSSSPSN